MSNELKLRKSVKLLCKKLSVEQLKKLQEECYANISRRAH
jgi:hypothetical protein